MLYQWKGNEMEVRVLYTKAGIATQILVSDIRVNEHILLDCGDGIVRDLLNNSIDFHQIKGILFTHGHPDHMGGLYSLLTTMRLFSREKELNIFAPSPCVEVYDIIQLFIKYYKKKFLFHLNYHELKNEVYENIGNFIVKPFSVLHYDSTKNPSNIVKKPAMGYRIKLREEVIIYSGDTLPCPELEREVEGVDLALLEATYDEKFNENRPNHLSQDYANYIGNTAKNYYLVHRF